MKRVLITGINGMDGSFLADFLLEKGYEVYGMERRSSSKNRINTGHLEGKITFVNGDLTDQNSLVRVLTTVLWLTMIFTFRIFMIIFSSFNDVIFFNFVVWSVFTANRLDQRTNTILTNEMILNDPQLKFRAQ